jgi:hypothetical protein
VTFIGCVISYSFLENHCTHTTGETFLKFKLQVSIGVNPGWIGWVTTPQILAWGPRGVVGVLNVTSLAPGKSLINTQCTILHNHKAHPINALTHREGMEQSAAVDRVIAVTAAVQTGTESRTVRRSYDDARH